MAMTSSTKWPEVEEQLRTILLSCGLTEERKWGKPCFTFDGNNIAIIIAFKDSCALSFLKGALLKDPKKLLSAPGENSQSARWIKFTTAQQIAKLKPTLKAYIHEAIAAEKAGLKIKKKTTADYPVPEELQKKFNQQPAFKKAFAALTPGRQRGYLLYFAAAKQSATRESRIEKYKPQILAGKGLLD